MSQTKKYKVTFPTAVPHGHDRGYIWVNDDNIIVGLEAILDLNPACGFTAKKYLGKPVYFLKGVYNLEQVPEKDKLEKIQDIIGGYRRLHEDVLIQFRKRPMVMMNPDDIRSLWLAEGRVYAADEIINLIKFKLS